MPNLPPKPKHILVELQPCPFCGGSKVVYVPDGNLHYVGCTECVIFACSSSAELSVSRWNARCEVKAH